MKQVCAGALAALLVALAGCSSANADWQNAQKTGTVAAYQNFVQNHPNDPRASQARTQIERLQDEQAWAVAQRADTTEAMQQYLQQQPNGEHAAEARERVASLERSAAWKTAQAAGTDAALRQFLQRYSSGPDADQARQRLAELDHYRVELASFHSKRQAERDREKLQARYGNVLGKVTVVPSGSSKKMNLVESGTMSLADAQAACTTLENSHQHCSVLTR